MTTQYISNPLVPQNNTKDTTTFNDWMFQHYKTPSTTDPQDSPSSTTWFEPLESILSSTTSSSVGSPISDLKFEPGDDCSFDEFTLNKLLEHGKSKLELGVTDPLCGNGKDVAFILKRPKIVGNGGRKQLTELQKQAHNRIEKKYRININTKIAKLQQIIPWLDTEETTFFSCLPDSNNNNSDACTKDIVPNTKKPRLNKSMILEKAIDYILYLQNNERLYELEVRRLKSELSQYKS